MNEHGVRPARRAAEYGIAGGGYGSAARRHGFSQEGFHYFTTEGRAMLVLTRKIGETIVIDKRITVTLLGVQGHRARIGIDAPPDVEIDRGEIAAIPEHLRRRQTA